MSQISIWPAWVAGGLIGFYLIFQYWITGKQLGCSSSYCNPITRFSSLHFFSSGEFSSSNNWRLWFFIGIPVGSAIAVFTSPGGEWVASYSMGIRYDEVLSIGVIGKTLMVFMGGIMMGYGARMADGCTSGHALAGIALLNPVSLLAATLFFSGGIIAVNLLFKVIN